MMGKVFCPVILLLLVVSINALTLDQRNCSSPRVRQRWGDLCTADQQNYLSAVNLMKSTSEQPYPTAAKNCSVHDCFTYVHTYQAGIQGTNTVYAHGCDGFLSWHRRFLYVYESTLREVVTKYNANLLANNQTTGFLDACVCIPYWDWENEYQKEANSSIYGNTTFGSNRKGCVTDGRFAGWQGISQTCLWRDNDPSIYGGLHNGPAQIANLVTQYSTFNYYNYYLRSQPHGDPHCWIGGVNGQLSAMISPDDPLFYLHHSNIDRLWAIWQDCYNYESVPTSSVNSSIHSMKWTVTVRNSTGTYPNTYLITDPFPFYYDANNQSNVYFRLSDTCRPLDMHSIGRPGNPGFKGMDYRYTTSLLTQSMKANFPICNFCDWVDYPIPNPPCLLGNTQKRDISGKNNTGKSEILSYNGTLFNNGNCQNVLNDINRKFPHHPIKNKALYLALWECSNQNKPKNRSNQVPNDWLSMNNQAASDWRTTCDIAGYRDGYLPFALLEDSKFALQPLGAVWVLPFIIAVVVAIVLGVIGVGTYYYLQKRDLNVLSFDNREAYERMLDEDVDE